MTQTEKRQWPTAKEIKDTLGLAKRRKINQAELALIYSRETRRRYGTDMVELVGAAPSFHDMDDWLRKFGECECGCSGRFDLEPGRPSSMEYEHTIPLGLQFEGDAVDWKIYRKSCHDKKTNGTDTETGDKTAIAKAKRLARKYGIEREINPLPEKRGNRKMNGPGFQKKPDGYKYQWPSRKVGA